MEDVEKAIKEEQKVWEAELLYMDNRVEVEERDNEGLLPNTTQGRLESPPIKGEPPRDLSLLVANLASRAFRKASGASECAVVPTILQAAEARMSTFVQPEHVNLGRNNGTLDILGRLGLKRAASREIAPKSKRTKPSILTAVDNAKYHMGHGETSGFRQPTRGVVREETTSMRGQDFSGGPPGDSNDGVGMVGMVEPRSGALERVICNIGTVSRVESQLEESKVWSGEGNPAAENYDLAGEMKYLRPCFRAKIERLTKEMDELKRSMERREEQFEELKGMVSELRSILGSK
jgi:hypothetical protein